MLLVNERKEVLLSNFVAGRDDKLIKSMLRIESIDYTVTMARAGLGSEEINLVNLSG